MLFAWRWKRTSAGVTTKPFIMTPDLRIVKVLHRFITCLGSLSAVILLLLTRRFMRRSFPRSAKSSESGLSGRTCVSVVSADPRRLSPSEAMEKRRHPISALSLLQAPMMVEISCVCLSLSSRLQVPVMMKGLEPHACLFSERIPIEKTVACHCR